MGFDRVLTQPCLLERLLKAIQDWLVRELYRVDPLLIRLGMVSFRHATSLLQLRRSSPVSAGCQDEFAILVFFTRAIYPRFPGYVVFLIEDFRRVFAATHSGLLHFAAVFGSHCRNHAVYIVQSYSGALAGADRASGAGVGHVLVAIRVDTIAAPLPPNARAVAQRTTLLIITPPSSAHACGDDRCILHHS